MNFDYEYRASKALENKEFRFIKIVYSILILGSLTYGIKLIISGDYITGNFLLIAALLNTLSPLTFFNFLGQKSPFDFYFIIQKETIKYKLNTFSTSKTINLADVARIGYAEQTIAIKFKNGQSQYIEANKIFGKAKQEELKVWIKKFSS